MAGCGQSTKEDFYFVGAAKLLHPAAHIRSPEPDMTYLLPPLNALRAFEAAARHLSFKLAAHELHVTAGAISQHVRQLEERLGIRLFDRLPRQVILTPAGEAYLGPVCDAFRLLADATASLKTEGIATVLHVGAHADFDIGLLRTHLARFRRAQPQVAVRISQPAGVHELLEGKVDVAIERGVRRYPGYRCDPLNGNYLICPLGTVDCPEVEALRAILLDEAPGPPASAAHRGARSRLPA
jgi:LysR family glycine cleavage system transcriptional activator